MHSCQRPNSFLLLAVTNMTTKAIADAPNQLYMPVFYHDVFYYATFCLLCAIILVCICASILCLVRCVGLLHRRWQLLSYRACFCLFLLYANYREFKNWSLNAVSPVNWERIKYLNTIWNNVIQPVVPNCILPKEKWTKAKTYFSLTSSSEFCDFPVVGTR